VRTLVRWVVALALAAAGCDDGRATPTGSAPRTRSDVGTSTPTPDASTRPLETDAGTVLDGDAGGLDGASFDAGTTADAAAGPDAAAGADATAAPDARTSNPDAAAPPDSGPPSADVQITTTCNADFGGDPIVSHNGSIAVGSMRGFSLAASLQFDFRGQTGVIALGTRHRIETGLVVNLVLQSTWTNLSQDTQVITGMRPDTIGGTLNLRSYDGPRGIMDVELTNVRLQNPSDLSFCTVNGRIRAQRLGR
jgi:hypothetical protein